MLVFAGKLDHLRHLGLCHLVGIYAALADPMLMHLHHDFMCGLVILVEEPLEHMHHEFPRPFSGLDVLELLRIVEALRGNPHEVFMDIVKRRPGVKPSKPRR